MHFIPTHLRIGIQCGQVVRCIGLGEAKESDLAYSLTCSGYPTDSRPILCMIAVSPTRTQCPFIGQPKSQMLMQYYFSRRKYFKNIYRKQG